MRTCLMSASNAPEQEQAYNSSVFVAKSEHKGLLSQIQQ